MDKNILQEILSSNLIKRLAPARDLNEYALVLGGGGAKGSYEVGVMKALLDLGIRIKGVYGTSIGALNGAFFAAGKTDVLVSLWLNIKLSDIFHIPESFKQDGEINVTKFKLSNLIRFQKHLFKEKGLDNSPLRNLLEKNLNEEEIRNSSVHFGLVTFNVSQFKPEALYIDQIKKGELVDYIMASSNLPVFKNQKKKELIYTDGGVYDNVPFELAFNQGFRKIIVVDVKGLGRRRRVLYENLDLLYIKARHDTGLILTFDKEKLLENIIKGYLDTLSIFECLEESHQYYFYPPSSDDLPKTFLEAFNENLHLLLKFIPGTRDIFNIHGLKKKLFLKAAGITAFHLNLDKLRIYSDQEIISEFSSQYQKTLQNDLFKSLDLKHLFRNFSEKVGSAKIWVLFSYMINMEKSPEKKRKFLDFMSRFSYFKELLITYCVLKTSHQFPKKNTRG